jgi:hypothetical protein
MALRREVSGRGAVEYLAMDSVRTFGLVAVAVAVLSAALAASGCTTSDTLGYGDAAEPPNGAAGTSSASVGRAGSNGAAGTEPSSGAAGTVASSGAAGTSGGAGISGGAGTTSTGPDGGTPGVGGAGAAGSGATTDPPLTYTSYIGPILTNNGCGGCHYIAQNGVPPYMGGFGLSYENFMAAVTPAHAGCPNLDASRRRVVPGDPDHSLIYIKISVANLPGSCGGHMPYMGTSLSATYQMKVRQWILNGAPK